jgi:uridine phosphorylase
VSRRAPILEYPGSGQAIIEPARLHAKAPRIAKRCVLCFFMDVIREAERAGRLTPIARLHGEGDPIIIYGERGESEEVAVVWPGIGSAYAASSLEELIALGCRAIVAVGGAGVLDGDIPVGQLMLPTAALRDEGTSYHYQRRGRFSRPAPAVVKAIRAACRAAGHKPITVATWTTDGVYRETPAAIRARRREGCRAVEMEAAAFFAVAEFRRALLGQLLYAGDDVSGERWQHRDWIKQASLRSELLELGLDAVRRVPLADE